MFQIEDIGPGKITEIVIDNKGTGYEIGDALTFVNTGTQGSNAAGFVKVVNGGIADQNGSTAAATGVEDRIVLEDETKINKFFRNRWIWKINTDRSL